MKSWKEYQETANHVVEKPAPLVVILAEQAGKVKIGETLLLRFQGGCGIYGRVDARLRRHRDNHLFGFCQISAVVWG